MIYLIDKKLWKDSSETQIRNSIGEVVMRLEKSSSTFSTSYIIYDRYHVPLGEIKKTGFRGRFEVTYDGKVIGVISETSRWFRKRITVSNTTGKDFGIKGNIKIREYTIYRGRKKIGQVHPKLGSSSSTYGFESVDKVNKYLLLNTVLALQIMFP